jgi:hypothetical protein
LAKEGTKENFSFGITHLDTIDRRLRLYLTQDCHTNYSVYTILEIR